MSGINARRRRGSTERDRRRLGRDRLRLEALECRTLLDAQGWTGYNLPTTVVGPAPWGGSGSQISQSLLDVVRADPTITTLDWQGREYLAKAGQWITRFSDVTGSPAEQLHAIDSRLTEAGLPFHATRYLGLDGIVLLEGEANLGSAGILAGLESVPGFRYAEPNLVQANALTTLPNDPLFDNLYGLNNTGQFIPGLGFGTPNADINAPEAWNITTGSSSIVVADIDTGVDYTHPDLAANMWHNPGEIQGNGLDDDGNGYVDDYYGYDFINNDSDPFDDNGHGTHTSGTIGAVGNNLTGVVGVNWNVQIMALKWIAGNGFGTVDAAIAAINYATMMADRGINVKVSSNSWHVFGPSEALKESIAAHGAAGILFVVAAGNDGVNRDVIADYPSSYRPELSNMITVAATDNNDFKADFSAYGLNTIDLGAPGVNVLSTVPYGSGYDFFSGTSMATPHVAGVAALAWSIAPDATYQEIRDAIFAGVDPVNALRTDGPTPVATGGRLNAFNTLQLLGFRVNSSSPADGEVVFVRPTQFVVNLSDPVDPATVQASDLQVNGLPASSYALSDGNRTVTFTYTTSPVTNQGQQTLAVADGAMARADDGKSIRPFSASFRYDAVLLQVTSTTPAVGTVVTLPLPKLRLTFNEPYDPASIGTNDLTLSQGTVTGFTFVNSTTVDYLLSGITEEGTLTAGLAAGAVADAFGNPGGAFSGSYTLDIGTVPFPTPLESKPPLGSLIYDPGKSGVIGTSGDIDSFTLLVDPGQKITVVVDPDPALRPVIELYRVEGGSTLIGSATAGGAGLDAVLQSIATQGQLGGSSPAAKTYKVTVKGANGTTGGYKVHVILNAAVEAETHDGASDNTRATAQSLTPAFLSFNTAVTGVPAQNYPGRAAVLGQTEYAISTVYSANFESGTNGFTVDNGPVPDAFHLEGLWHLSTGRGSQAGHSGTQSFYYGTGEGPDGGGSIHLGTVNPTAGSIVSPSIALPLGGVLQLDFNYVLQTRGFPSDVDFASLQINAGAGWTTLQRYDRVAESTTWRASDPVDLSAYAGQTVQLRWNFDTIRGPVGRFPEGWYVDDVRIRQFTATPDYYSFSLAKGESITLALTGLSGGDVKLALENSSGTALALGTTGASNVGAIIADFVADANGTYYARVIGSNITRNDYSLLVTRNAEFDTESNDELASAQDLISNEVAGQRWVLGSVGGSGAAGDLSKVRGPAYIRSVVGPPWGSNSNEVAMDRVFGPGNWFDLRFETVDPAELFSNNHDFVFLEGSDNNADELEAFLVANQARIEQFVAAGHTLLLNSAPNEGDGMSFGFGDVVLAYPDFSPNVSAADPQHPIFQGPFQPVTTNYSGNAFGHATVTGSGLVPLLLNSSTNGIVLAEQPWGQGLVLFGGMTTNNFHSPQPEADNLRANIIAYAAAAGGGDPSDFYRITVNENAMLQVQTMTPAGTAGEFVNTLDPMVRIYNAAGHLVASDDNSALDGRNVEMKYKVPKGAGGTYYIEVLSSTATADPTKGEYVLSVKQATGALPPFAVESTTIPDGSLLYNVPQQITVDFNDTVLLTTLQASDLKVDGVSATGMTVVDGDTARFDIPSAYPWSVASGGNGHYYLLTRGARSFADAEAEAVALGGHLVSVNTQAEQDFLKRAFFSDGHRFDVFWIGLNDNAAEGNFVWTSGEPVTYTNWGPGEPNDFPPGEDATTINWYWDINHGAWNDFFTDHLVFGIIELNALPAGYWSATEGAHHISIAAGSIKDVQNTPINAYSSTFTIDQTPPRVVSSSIQENAHLSPGDLTYTVAFSEAMRTGNLDASDISLVGLFRGQTYSPDSLSYNATGTVLTLHFSGLLDDLYTLTLYSGDGAFEDVLGLDLDGEPTAWQIPPNRSGDGIEGGDFYVHFVVDAGTQALPVPLVPVRPLGGLIYQTPASALGTIAFGGDLDNFTINLDAGQTIAVMVRSETGGLQPTVKVYNPANVPLGPTATAPAPGGEALFQATALTGPGMYRIEVGSAAGLGLYSVQLVVNAAIEAEAHGGTTNGDLGSAQPLDASFIALASGASRGAVLGQTAPPTSGGYSASAEPFTFEDISATGNPILIGSDDGSWYLSPSDLAGFEFTLYGTTNTDLYVSANGSLFLPAGSGGNVFAMSRDLVIFGAPDAAVYWQVFGTGADQRLVVEWKNVGFYGFFGADPITFEVVLNEADGSVQYNYLDLHTDVSFLDEGLNATVGIQGYPGGSFSSLILPTSDAPNEFVGTGRSTRIAPVPPPIDFYSFSLEAGQSATVALANLGGGAVDVALLAPDGTPLALGVPGGTNVDEVIDTFIAPGAGTYYLKVTGDGGVDYSLVVTRGALLDLEPNDDPGQAQPILGAGGALGGLFQSGVKVTHTFEGIDGLHNGTPFPFLRPPDTNASVGNNFVVETVNEAIRVFDKTTGSILLDESLATFFGTQDGGDPYVVYDDTADRWYVTAFDGSQTGLFLAVSVDGNPMHGFLPTYHLDAVGGFPDYEKLGFNKDAIFISFNDFGSSGGQATIAAIDKAAALGGTLVYYVSHPAPQFRAMPPAQMHGDTTGGVEWFVSTDGNDFSGSTIRVTSMTNYLSDSPTFTYTSLPVTFFQAPQRADQPGGGLTIFPNTTTTQVQYRNGHLVSALASGTAADGFVYPKGLWYQIDVSAGSPTLLREGVIDPGPGVAVQMPSVDEDIHGNLGFTWMESSSTEFLSMWVATLSPSGQFDSTAAAPGGGFFFVNDRIGDYSTTVLDPTDGLTFWSANEYIGDDGGSNIWKTKIVAFQVPAGGDSDWYSVSLSAGSTLTLATSTPAGGPGEFVNNLDPMIGVYDSGGGLLVSNDNGAGDGRNAALTFTATVGGTYYIKVSPSNLTDPATQGEYFLSVSGASLVLPPFQVTAIDPADGSRLRGPVTTITVDFNDTVLLTSLQAGDLTVDGVPATDLVVVDGNTASFTVPGSLTEGNHVVAIAAGAIQDIQGTPIGAFASTFYNDITPPRVVWSSIQEGDTLPAGDLTYTVVFSEAMSTANLDNGDFSLFGSIRGVFYSPVSASFDAGGTTLTLQYVGLPEDNYTLTLFSGDFAFEDAVGWDLDGEPPVGTIPPNQSGDGVEGGNYFVDFSLDTTTAAYPTPLTSKAPLGSLIYDPIVTGLINFAGDTDSYTLNLDPGQTLTLVVSGGGVPLYGGVGNGSFNQGSLLRIDAATGGGTFISDPVNPGGLTGLVFDPSSGLLLGSTIRNVGNVSTLVQIDPATGALLGTVGVITDGPGGPGISIGDLAIQPGTDVLYGIGSNAAGFGGRLYTIDKATGVATFVGDTGAGAGGGIAFAPDGSLYQTAFNNFFDFPSLNQINPADASRISTVFIPGYFDGLAIRPSDGVFFAADGGSSDAIYTIDPTTGSVTFVGGTGQGSPSDLAFGVGGFTPTIELRDPSDALIGSTVAAPGQDAVLQTVAISVGGAYTITVGEASGATGLYKLQSILNAAVELELHGGAGNDTPADAQNIEASFIDLLKTANRGAVVGRTDPAGDHYSFTIGDGQTLAIVAKALGSGTVHLELLDPGGNVVATGVGGAGNVDESIGFTATTGGLYVVRVTSGQATDYSLVVTRDAVFDLEPNDRLADAQPLGPVHVALGHVGTPARFYGSSRNGELFTIDTATGAATFVGFLPVATTEIEYDNLSGRAFAQALDGSFFGTEFDINTGAGIGGFVFNGASFNGLEWVGGTLYGTAITGPGGPSTLQTLDPYSGTSVIIGPTGFGPISGLAYDALAGVMYGITGGFGSSSLVTIDLATGAATTIGSTGFQAGSLEFGPDGLLYGGGTGVSAGQLFRVDPSTGSGTLVGFTGFSSVTGLALVQGDLSDWYSFTATAGESIHLFTSTPADGPGEFGNTLNPHLRLFDSSGNLVAEGVPLGDGRNEEIIYPDAAAGTYSVEVSAEGGTSGEYVLDPSPVITTSGTTQGPEAANPAWGTSNLLPTGNSGGAAILVSSPSHQAGSKLSLTGISGGSSTDDLARTAIGDRVLMIEARSSSGAANLLSESPPTLPVASSTPRSAAGGDAGVLIATIGLNPDEPVGRGDRRSSADSPRGPSEQAPTFGRNVITAGLPRTTTATFRARSGVPAWPAGLGAIVPGHGWRSERPLGLMPLPLPSSQDLVPVLVTSGDGADGERESDEASWLRAWDASLVEVGDTNGLVEQARPALAAIALSTAAILGAFSLASGASSERHPSRRQVVNCPKIRVRPHRI